MVFQAPLKTLLKGSFVLQLAAHARAAYALFQYSWKEIKVIVPLYIVKRCLCHSIEAIKCSMIKITKVSKIPLQQNSATCPQMRA